MNVDLASSESIRDPSGYFRSAKDRGGVVQWSEHHRAWVVLSHAEVEAGFRESTVLSADRSESFQRAAMRNSPAFGIVAELLSGWMNFRDDPAHIRLREPVRAAFTPRAVGALEADIRAMVGQAIEAFEGDSVDLYEAFARPIPALVIATLLGADPKDRRQFQDWSDDIAKIVFSAAPGTVSEEPVVRATQQFVAFFSRLIERERTAPSGNLLSAIVHSEVGELGPIELVGRAPCCSSAATRRPPRFSPTPSPSCSNDPSSPVAARASRPPARRRRGVHARRGTGAHHGSEGRDGPCARREGARGGSERLPLHQRGESRRRGVRGACAHRSRARAEPSSWLWLGPALLPRRQPRSSRGASSAAHAPGTVPEARAHGPHPAALWRSDGLRKAPADGSIEIDARAGFGSASADEWAARIGARSFAMFGRARTWGRGPWRNVEDVEFATLAWVDWFNNRRLLSSIGNVPPVEFEERYYADKTSPATEVGLN